jgi:hypothetical protein
MRTFPEQCSDEEGSVKAIEPTTYQSVQEVEAIIRLRQGEADVIPPGLAKQSVLLEIARLRAYADVKR